MQLVYLTECGQSGTSLGRFLEALMRSFEPGPFVLVTCQLENNLGLYKVERDRGLGFTTERQREVLKHFEELERLETEYGFTVSSNITREYIKVLNTDEQRAEKYLDENIRAARTNLRNEMATFCYLEIQRSDIALWNGPDPFGPEVTRKFRDAVDDIKEAARCLAVERGTACVMHLARVMEHVLRAFGVSLGAKFKASDDWQAMLDEVETLIKPMPTASMADAKRKDALREAHANLHRVKLAWRLPAAHSRGDWDAEQAREIFGSCRAFSKNVAGLLP